MADSVSAELMGGAGFDWVIVDTQHGSVTNADLVRVIQALALGNTSAVVRIPWTDAATIMRALDVGRGRRHRAHGQHARRGGAGRSGAALPTRRHPLHGSDTGWVRVHRRGQRGCRAAGHDRDRRGAGPRRRDRRRARCRRPVRRPGRSGPEPRLAARLDRATSRRPRGHGQDRGRGGQRRCLRRNG